MIAVEVIDGPRVEVIRESGRVEVFESPKTVEVGMAGPRVSDNDYGDVRVSTGVWHFERTNGCPGNGTSNDAPYWNDMLAAGKTVVLSDRKSYLWQSPVIPTVAGTGIIAPMGASVVMDMDAFTNSDFSNTRSVSNTGGSAYAVGLKASGLDGFFLKGGDGLLKIRPNRFQDAVYLRAVYIDGGKDVEVERLDIAGFSRMAGLIGFRDSAGIKVRWNYLHDCYTLSIYEADGSTLTRAARVQVTAIDGDDTVLAGGTADFDISHNYIWNLCNGPAILAQFGNVQNDGINIKGIEGKSRKGRIFGNTIRNVAEAIDYFGSDTLIACNNLQELFAVAIKLFHSASNNHVEGNIINDVGLAGIYSGGSNSSALNSKNNFISRSNKIGTVNSKRDWYMDYRDTGSTKFFDSLGGTHTFWNDVYNIENGGTITAGVRLDVLTQLITTISKVNSTTVRVTYTGSDAYTVGETYGIANVAGMTQINGGAYLCVAIDTTANTIDLTTPDNSAWGSYTSGGRIAARSQCEAMTIEGMDMNLGGNADRGIFVEGNGGGFVNYVNGKPRVTGLKSGGRRIQDSANYLDLRGFDADRLTQLVNSPALTADTSAQNIFTSGTGYNAETGEFVKIRIEVNLSGLSSTSSTFSISFAQGAGFATFVAGAISLIAEGNKASGVGIAYSTDIRSVSAQVVVSASTSGTGKLIVTGTMLVNSGGLITPQITQSVGASATVLAGSFFEATRITYQAATGAMS